MVKARRAISLGSPDSPFSSAESSRTPSTVNSFDYDDTSIFTVQSSFDDDRTNTSNETPPRYCLGSLGITDLPQVVKVQCLSDIVTFCDCFDLQFCYCKFIGYYCN